MAEVITMPRLDSVEKGREGFPLSDGDLTVKLDYSGGSDPIYVAKAPPGTLVTVAGWQIQKLTYDGANLTDSKWATGTHRFIHVYNDRASYTYS